MKTSLRIVGALIASFFLTLLLIIFLARPETAEIEINGTTYVVRVADGPLERYRGLSGVREGKLGAQGMVFLFSHDEVRTFSMRGMKFPLDFAWVRNGIVVDTDDNIPAPEMAGEKPVTLSSDPLTADMVIEFPAGFLKEHDIFIGTAVKMK